jgi:hypothetical protein
VSLKEGANSVQDSNGGADRIHEVEEPSRTSEAKIRKCLICRAPFPSAWSGERICRRCKSSSTWRSGVL